MTILSSGEGGKGGSREDDAFWPPTFPLFLLLKNRRCLVLGSDGVARDKVAALLQAQADVAVVGRDWHPDLAQWLASGQITLAGEVFAPDQLHHVWLVVNTLTDDAVRWQVWQETEKRCIFLNTVDVQENCTAYWPALLQRPPVTVAISTGGASPALAGYLRRKIAAILPDSFLPLARWLQHWRKWVATQVAEFSNRASLWQTLMKDGLIEHYLAGRQELAEHMIRQAVEKKVACPQDKPFPAPSRLE